MGYCISRILAFTAVVCVASIATPAWADGPDKGGPDRAGYSSSLWQGLYAGLHVGVGSTDGDDDGLIAGAQVGYNWHWNPVIVYGLEADMSIADGDLDWLASVRGRAGYLIDPRILAYVTFGFGFVNDHHGTDSDVVYGLGVEGRVNPGTTVRLEYLSYGDLDVSVVRAGINFKLNR